MSGAQFDRAQQLADKYCSGTLSTDSTSGWPKFVMRGDPLSRGMNYMLRAISTDWPMTYILNSNQTWPKKFSEQIKWPGLVVAAVLVVLVIIFFIVALVMLPLCCCRCYRSCWGTIFCHKCVQDRPDKRMRPIAAVTHKKQSCLTWTVGFFTILGMALALLALAFGIKFVWTPKYALCQVARLGFEIQLRQPLLNPQDSRCKWLPSTDVSYNITEDVWVDTPDTDTSYNLMKAPVWTATQDVYDAIFTDDMVNSVGDAAKYSFIGLVVLPVLALFGLIWGCVLLFRLKRYVRQGREPQNLKKYARVFAFLWGWYAFFGLLLLLITIPSLLAIGATFGPCRLMRRVPRSPELLNNYSSLTELYNPQNKTDPSTVFTRFAIEGWSAEDVAFDATGASTYVTFLNEKVARVLVNSIGSTVDGFCGGILGDLTWSAVPLFLLGLIHMVLWPIAYKICHYFYDRHRAREKGEDDTPSPAQKAASPTSTKHTAARASPSTVLAEALSGDTKEFNNLAKDIDIKNVRDPNYDNTTLHCAAFAGDVVLVRECLNRGVPVDSRNKFGYTALAVAASEGHAHVVQELLAAGADPSIQDEHGETPMHVAARGGDLNVVTALCNAGVDPALRNDEDEIPVDVAAHHQQLPVEEFLDVRTPRGVRKTPLSLEIACKTPTAADSSPAAGEEAATNGGEAAETTEGEAAPTTAAEV